MCSNHPNETTRTIKALDRALELARVAEAEEQADAGFPPEWDGVRCAECGAPTADDGDKLCQDCMPSCAACGDPCAKLEEDMCPRCLDHSYRDAEERLAYIRNGGRIGDE